MVQVRILKNVGMRAHQQTSFIMSAFKHIFLGKLFLEAKSGSGVLLFCF